MQAPRNRHPAPRRRRSELQVGVVGGDHLPVAREQRLGDRDDRQRRLDVAPGLDPPPGDRDRDVLLALEVRLAVSELIVILTLGSQSMSSDHSQARFGSPAPPARMLTTRSRSVNSNRCGVSASRSLGPISGSSLISANVRSMTSRNSLGERELRHRAAQSNGCRRPPRKLPGTCPPSTCTRPRRWPSACCSPATRAARCCSPRRCSPSRRCSTTTAGCGATPGERADGEPLTIQSTGMGGPSAAIVIAELADLGARTLLRVGTCGGARRGAGARRAADRHRGARRRRHQPGAGRRRRVSRADAGAAGAAARAAGDRRAPRAGRLHRPVLRRPAPGTEERWRARGRAGGRDGGGDAVRAGRPARAAGRRALLIVSDLLLPTRRRIDAEALREAEHAARRARRWRPWPLSRVS